MRFLKTELKISLSNVSLTVLGNCSDEGWVVPRSDAPGFPIVTAEIAANRDDSGQFAPVLFITWRQLPDSKMCMMTYRYAQDHNI